MNEIKSSNTKYECATVTFSITTLLCPIFMIFAGKLLPKIEPQKTVLVGAAFLIHGLIISSCTYSLPMLYLGYGFMGGVGSGFIYGVPIATSVKWFPDKKGLISGLTVAGFGMGSIIFAPICTMLIESVGPNKTSLVQAVITVIGTTIGAPMMKTAPDGFQPDGHVCVNTIIV